VAWVFVLRGFSAVHPFFFACRAFAKVSGHLSADCSWRGCYCERTEVFEEVKDMTKFFIKWWVNVQKLPNTPQEAGKLHLAMLEMVKADMRDGRMIDWGQFSNGANGYCIGDLSEQDLFGIMLKYMPVIGFDVFPVLSVDQSIEEIKKAAAAMQG
jgi:hypothetical protein